MSKLKFTQLQRDSEEHYKLFESLMIPYNQELDNHTSIHTDYDFILKVTRGILNMQGPYDRHLELCYDEDKLIGFLYGKVDHETHKGFIKPGYGYIMEFYVKPEFRRNGYGKDMFKRLEEHFASHGVKRMYLTADPVTGKPFWEAMGFENIGQKSPENGQDIFEKAVRNPCEMITIEISEYLNDEILKKITTHHGTMADKVFNSLTYSVSFSKLQANYFGMVASNRSGDIIGYAGFIQNEKDSSKWIYTDLWIAKDYRRQGIATRLVKSGFKRLSDIGAKQLYCTVDVDNTASFALQKSLGFAETQPEPFNELFVDGLIMFRLDIPDNFNAIPLTPDNFYIGLVCGLLTDSQNITALHTKQIQKSEYKTFFKEMHDCFTAAEAEGDEKNFIIRKGIVPVAWIKINGLYNAKMAWISMLVVNSKFKHKGIGTYAVRFAEDHIRSKGKRKVGIHTTDDNIPAQNLYKKCGYTITGHGECTTGDGVKRTGYTFIKEL